MNRRDAISAMVGAAVAQFATGMGFGEITAVDNLNAIRQKTAVTKIKCDDFKVLVSICGTNIVHEVGKWSIVTHKAKGGYISVDVETEINDEEVMRFLRTVQRAGYTELS